MRPRVETLTVKRDGYRIDLDWTLENSEGRMESILFIQYENVLITVGHYIFRNDSGEEEFVQSWRVKSSTTGRNKLIFAPVKSRTFSPDVFYERVSPLLDYDPLTATLVTYDLFSFCLLPVNLLDAIFEKWLTGGIAEDEWGKTLSAIADLGDP